MINLYEIAEKVVLINSFRPPHKNLPYTALFYRTMTLKVTMGGGGKLSEPEVEALILDYYETC